LRLVGLKDEPKGPCIPHFLPSVFVIIPELVQLAF
jgi:hypothetical protein